MSNERGYQVRLSDEQKAEIRTLYLSGLKVEDAMSRYHCSSGAFWNIVRGIGSGLKEQRVGILTEKLAAMSDLEKGWIAGIVDGEGYIGLVETVQRGTDRSLTPRVDVVSTTRSMQDALRRFTGIGYVGNKSAGARLNRKPTHGWSLWASETVGPFLDVIGPHLIVKKEMAEVVGGFCRRRMAAPLSPYTEEDWMMLRKIRNLNKRGL